MEELIVSSTMDSAEAALAANREVSQQTFARDYTLESGLDTLTDVAAMAFGHGVGEGVKGGKGHIGLLNGRVVKFNTTRAERQALVKGSATYDAMLKASDTLRYRLITTLQRVEQSLVNRTHAGFNPATVAEFRVLQKNLARLLGAQLNTAVGKDEPYLFLRTTDPNEMARVASGSEYGEAEEARTLEENRGLLDRSAAAKAVTLIRDFLMQHAANPQTTAKDSALLKGAFAAESVPLDLHIWRKVKSMHTTTRAAGSDGFAYARAVDNAMKDVTRFVKENGERLRGFGNAAAKDELLSVQVKPERNELDAKFTLKIGAEEITGLDVKQAKGMARLHRDLVLAKSMDAMFKEMLNIRGLADQRPAALRALGETPFQDMLKRSLAAVLGRQPTDVADLLRQKVWLTPNEHRNMLALLRKEVLTFVADLGNERQEGPAGADGRLSADVMIAKDLLLQGSKVFRVDLDNADCKLDLVEENKTKSVRNDNFFPANSAGSYMYKKEGLGIFTEATYCLVNEAAHKVEAEDAVRTAMKETLAAHLLDDFSAEKLQLSNKAGVQDGRPLVPEIPENKREAAKAVMQSVLGKLVDRYGLPTKDELAAVRESFCEEMANVLIAADDGGERPSINTRVRNVLADHETKEFLRTLFGTSFDVKIATLFAKDAFGLRTDYAPEELGAGTDARYRSEVTGGSTFNAGQVVQDVKDACRGKDYRKAFALALNRFSEQAQGLKDATNVQKADYLVALGQMRRLLGQTDIAQKRSEDVMYALRQILHGVPHRLDAKLEKQFGDLLAAVAVGYPATKEQTRHYEAEMAREIDRMQRGRGPEAVAPAADGAAEAAEKGFTDEDRGMVDEIAAYAYGSGEGSDGGAGYMGVYNGTMTKFLTHSGERTDIGKGLTDVQQKAVGDATAALRQKLTALADKLPAGAEKTRIANLLARNPVEIAAHNGLDLLSRKTVAQVVTLLAEGAKKAGQTLFSWKGLEPADTVADTSFKTLFKKEEEFAKKLAQVEARTVEKVKGTRFAPIIEMLADPKAVDDAVAEIDELLKAQGLDSPIVDCRAVKMSEGIPVGNLAQQFEIRQGDTQDVAKNLHASGKKTCALVYADGHYFACGVTQQWDTQEETLLSDFMDPKVAAWMLKKGLIRKTLTAGGSLRYEYTQQLSTTGGGYFMTEPTTGRSLLFFSMPSLTDASASFDLRGNINWLNDARSCAPGGRELTQTERGNATKFLKEFYALTDSRKVGLNSTDYALAMKYLLFANDDLNFNMCAHRRDADMKQEVQKFLAFVKNELANNRADFEKKANAGYDRTVGIAFGKMTIAARKCGVKVFVGGPIGCGAFRNNPKEVAPLFKKGFAENGGDMQYVYPQRDAQEDDKDRDFRETFLGGESAAQKA